MMKKIVSLVAVVVLAATFARPASAVSVSILIGDGNGLTTAQHETFMPLTGFWVGTRDFAVIDFRNSSATPDLTYGVTQLVNTFNVDLQIISGNLTIASGDKDVTHDFVYTNTITVNGVTQSFSQNAHAEFNATNYPTFSYLLELSTVPLMTFDLGVLGLLDLDISARTISYNCSTACGYGGAIGSQIFATLREPAAVPLPAALPLFATGLGVMGLLRWRRKNRMAKAAA